MAFRFFGQPNIVFGGFGDDTLTGTSGRDHVFGLFGDDLIDGGAGDDRLYGGFGDDTFLGGAGDDRIGGGRGEDTVLYEGAVADYDIARGKGLFAPVIVSALRTDLPDAGIDRLKGIEALHFRADDFTLFLDGRNNPVLAGDDAVSAAEDGVSVLPIAGLLANDREFDGDALSFVSVAGQSAAGANVTRDGDVLRYDPGNLFQSLGAGQTATDSFTYVVDDGRGGRDSATVTVTVIGSNDAPVLSFAAAPEVPENTLTVPAAVSAIDAEGDNLQFSVSGGADAARFAIDAATGALSFVTAPDFEAPADADGDNLYQVEISVFDGQGGSDSGSLTVRVSDVDELPVVEARINEIHYDNAGADVGEFVEIRTRAGDDVSQLLIELYNGTASQRSVYDSVEVATLTRATDGTFDYYVWEPSSIQNGAPDGIALSNGGQVIEFLSYEGIFEAADGTAAGLTSTDIGVAENSGTQAGQSLQRNEDGSWRGPETETRGTGNAVAPPAPSVALNELAVSTTGTDWEFAELIGTPGRALDGVALLQLDGDGEIRSILDFGGQSLGENGFFLAGSAQATSTFGVTPDLAFDNNTFTNTSSTFLLVEGFTGASQFDDLDTDDDGTLDATPFAGILDSVAVIGADTPLTYSPNVIGPDGSFLAPGAARSPDGTGDFVIRPFADASAYSPTAGGTGTPGGGTPLLISQVQGNGTASPRTGETVRVEAVVTFLASDGFFLQEEDADNDGDAGTSEGIFVFTGAGAALPAIGDQVSVTGTVTEFFGETQLSAVSDITVAGTGRPLPTAAEILLSPDTAQDFEAVEGMRISLDSGTDERITVIENFNLDRFGEITVSAGDQFQPTQLFDPESQAAEVAALTEANLNNRLIIDDGSSAQNPTEFRFVPASAGDNGNGFLDAGDAFSAAGPTLRLGAEIDGPTTGVMRFGFGEFRMLVDGTLNIDETTNTGARQTAPDPVGGDVQIAAINVLNYFTTRPGEGGSGPNGLDPRGASSEADLARQTTKLVEAFLTTGAEVFALQELENNGFGPDSAISTLVDALNAEAASRGTGALYSFVDPTGGSPDGFIGTDAITTGLIYDTTKLNLVAADFHVFEEASADVTAAHAAVLNPFVDAGDRVEDEQRNRPAVGATFEDATTGKQFTVVSNHFKSKGDSGLSDLAAAAQAALDAGATGFTQADIDALRADPNFDQGDGQAFWNAARSDAAAEVKAWVETGFAGTGTTGYLLLGDFNAYAQETPVRIIADAANTVDLLDTFVGQEDAFSFIFDGQRGALDHAFGSAGIAGDVTGLTEWHINAEEPDLLSFNSRFNDPRFFSADVFASSDHDPLILGLDTSADIAIA